MHTETTYYRSPIGILEISSEEDKISAILFTNSSKGATVDEELISFDPPSSAVILECTLQLDQYFSGERKVFSVDTTQSGTDFQQEVWKELMNIPFGKTISYHELSKRLKNGKAIRAVGAANGNNSIAIVVPCHRVIGSNGDLVGYAGDLWRKQWLLEHEAKLENGVQMLF
jgi:methylated-DNA-[protein]-cysteine S-methyltransferase